MDWCQPGDIGIMLRGEGACEEHIGLELVKSSASGSGGGRGGGREPVVNIITAPGGHLLRWLHNLRYSSPTEAPRGGGRAIYYSYAVDQPPPAACETDQ